jgi:hypothetical protein
MWLGIKTPLFAGNIKMLTFCLSIFFFFCFICHGISPSERNSNQTESQTDGYPGSHNTNYPGKNWLGIIPKFTLEYLLIKHMRKKKSLRYPLMEWQKRDLKASQARHFLNTEQMGENNNFLWECLDSKRSSNPSQFLGHTLCKLFYHQSPFFPLGTFCVPTLLLAGWEHALHCLLAARATHIMWALFTCP